MKLITRYVNDDNTLQTRHISTLEEPYDIDVQYLYAVKDYFTCMFIFDYDAAAYRLYTIDSRKLLSPSLIGDLTADIKQAIEHLLKNDWYVYTEEEIKCQ